MGDIFPGVEIRPYDVQPLAAGAYQFVCSVHPNMVGTLTVQ
jgi:plastocyanin